MSTQLRGVTFRAWRGGEFIPLIELLLVVGRWIVDDVAWQLRDVEFAPGWRGSDELNVMSHQATLTPTCALVDLVSDGVQLIDGCLEAFKNQSTEPFLVIRSVRGDDWDLQAADAEVLDAVRECFKGAVNLPT